jgi:hypothetical protein
LRSELHRPEEDLAWALLLFGLVINWANLKRMLCYGPIRLDRMRCVYLGWRFIYDARQ